MKLGYIGMPDGFRTKDTQFKVPEQLTLADSLGFAFAYFPKADPYQFAAAQATRPKSIKVTLDASAFGPLCPTEIESAVRQVNEHWNGKLFLGLEVSGPDATAKHKAEAQAFETLFSYDSRADHVFSPTRFPMKPPCPEIIGVPVTGQCSEAKLAAARGYSPMTPEWLADTDVARIWPAIVAGATSSLRRARQSQWQVNRMVVVHDDAQTVQSYVYGANSPIRRHFSQMTQLGLIDGDVNALLDRVVIAGPVQKVADDILALRETVNDFGTLNMIDPVGSDPAITRNTMVCLAEKVMPIVDKSDVNTLKNLEKT